MHSGEKNVVSGLVGAKARILRVWYPHIILLARIGRWWRTWGKGEVLFGPSPGGCTPAEQSEGLDGLDEGALVDEHDHVDRVEVLPASEAAAEVGVRIDGGIELRAERTLEAKVSFGDLGRPFKDLADQVVDGDVVAECAKHFRTESIWHGRTFQITTAG